MKRSILVTVVCLMFTGFLFSCDKSVGLNAPEDGGQNIDLSQYSNQVILDWNLAALEAMGGPTYPLPLLNSRINAMMHIAMHDALNAVAPMYETYSYTGRNTSADPIAAIATAAHTVLVAHFSEHQAMLDEKLSNALSEIEEGKMKEMGIETGKAAANAILALRHNDGAFQDPIGTTETSAVPGVYQITPPFDFVYGEFWKTMKPFTLKQPEQFRSEPFPALTSQKYVEEYEEVKRIGKLDSEHRTEDETFTAKFWYELSEMGWNKVARIVTKDQNLDLHTTARLFALLDMAMADAYIAGWDSKYYYNFWRPITAIRAENNGNNDAVADHNWEPSEPTPPVPDYPSTHSALGNAAAKVLAYVVGDNTKFTMKSTTAIPAETARTFNSFSQAANENAASRVLAGIHFRSACDAGQKMGDEVGEWVINNQLRPLQIN